MLGPLQALAGGEPVALGGPKQRALLAELLLNAGALVPRDRLVDAVWGEEPPESATASLQVYVHGLRRAVGGDRIETHGTGYRIHVEQDELDLLRFERLLAQAERSLAEERPAAAADELDRALALWAGPPLADLSDQPVTRTAAPRLEEKRLRALELRNDAALALGEHDALLPELERLIAEQQYRERLREQQILALYRAGRQADALEAYRSARAALVDDLGVDPGPALQELERAVLRQDEALAVPASARPRQSSLPAPPTPLVGRRLEIAAVEALLRRDDVRLVTLTGPGGTGKTRLALAAAVALAPELRDGAVFVDLSAVVDPELVLPAIAEALAAPETDDVLEHLLDRAPLLVLDNLEQLGAETAPVAALLAAAPRVRVLATSRAPLRLSGEHEYPVPPLPLPGAHDSFELLAGNESVRLFAARAQAVSPDFSLTDENIGSVAAICRRLDGLPLAIELAAARTRVLDPDAIEQRLAGALDLLVAGARDLPARQQTLRATLDWSYQLLTEDERRLLAHTSVFAGGWTLESAEAVLGDDAALRLEGLLDSSLVRRRPPRFALLETIREYALERLRERGEEQELRGRHLEHFVAVAERAWAGILEGGGAEDRGYATLDAEQDNLRAALGTAVETGLVELATRLVEAQRWFWLVRGHFAGGRRAFDRVVSVTDDAPRLHALALTGSGTFASRQGDLELAKAQLDDARAIFTEVGDDDGLSRAIAERASVAVSEGDLALASALYRESIVEFERIGNFQRLAVALANLAAIAADENDPELAAEYGIRAIALQRENGDTDGLAVSLANLARVRLALGENEAARPLLRESIEIGLRIGYQLLLAYLLGAVAEIAARDGEHVEAARLLGASEALFESMGMPMPRAEADEQERTRASFPADLAAHEAEGRTAELDEMIRKARAFVD